MHKLIFRIILIVVSLTPIKLFSQQRIPYQTFDSLSKIIRTTLSDASNSEFPFDTDKSIRLYPEDNFGVKASNHLAYKSQTTIYKDSSENMTIIEDVDLSDAIGLYLNYNKDRTKVLVYLDFKPNSIKGIEIKNGVSNESTFGSMTFIANLNSNFGLSNNNLPPIAETLLYLCNLLRVEKGIVTQEEINSETTDRKTMNDEDFVAAHPNSLLAPRTIGRIKAQKKAALKKTNEDIAKLFCPDNFHMGMSMAEFRTAFPNFKFYNRDYNSSYNSDVFWNENHKYVRRNIYDEGYDQVSFRNDSLVNISKSVTFRYRDDAERFYREYNENLHKIAAPEYFSKLYSNTSTSEANSLYDSYYFSVATPAPGISLGVGKSYADDGKRYTINISLNEIK